MKYSGYRDYPHDSDPAYGVLLANLGTPDAPDRRSVRRYLRQFLSDPRVVEFPRWLWWLVLNGIILNLRPARSAAAYRHIWTDQGSPLLAVSRQQEKGLARMLHRRYGGLVKLELGMRYGNPSIPDALARLRGQAVRELLVLPLYPQYSGSTVGSVFDEVADCLKRWRWVPGLRFVSGYHDRPGYIDAAASAIQRAWNSVGRAEHLVISFHGVPKRYLLNGDPYYCQCHKTARLLAERLNLADAQWALVFQSRFGREEWLQPYCDEYLKNLPAQNIRNVDVVSPGFAADCLETLEEIDLQYRQQFLAAGGERFNYIPCLNDDDAHLEFLLQMVRENLPVENGSNLREPADRIQARALSRGARR